jgi:hypothetical protein
MLRFFMISSSSSIVLSLFFIGLKLTGEFTSLEEPTEVSVFLTAPHSKILMKSQTLCNITGAQILYSQVPPKQQVQGGIREE